MVTQEAFTAAVVPDPEDDSEYPARGWLWRDRMIQAYANAAGTELEPYFMIPEVRFDVRAMRKVDKGKLVLTVTKAGSVGSTLDVVYHASFRVLCML